jgi:hypothetical protein
MHGRKKSGMGGKIPAWSENSGMVGKFRHGWKNSGMVGKIEGTCKIKQAMRT